MLLFRSKENELTNKFQFKKFITRNKERNDKEEVIERKGNYVYGYRLIVEKKSNTLCKIYGIFILKVSFKAVSCYLKEICETYKTISKQLN